MSAIRTLLVEDSPTYAQLVRSMLLAAKGAEFELTHVEDIASGVAHVEKGSTDAILLDLMLPDSSGLDTLRRIAEVADSPPILVLTSVDDEKLSLQALHEGAADYLIKSEVSANWLTRSLIYAIERRRVEKANADDEAEEKKAAQSMITVRQNEEDESEFTVKFNDRRLVSVIAMEKMKTRLLGIIEQDRTKSVRMDFSDVDYVANAAISMLLMLNKRAQRADCQMVLENVSNGVHDHFKTRRFDRVFDIRRASSDSNGDE